MNPVEINKLEYDIANRIDAGDTDEQIAEYLVVYSAHSEDLIKVIRNLYNELQNIYKEQEGPEV